MPEMDHDAVKDLRKNIAKIELWAEQIERAMLFEAACALSDGAAAGTGDDAVRRNVTALLQRKIVATSPPPFRIAVGRAVDRGRHRMPALTGRKT